MSSETSESAARTYLDGLSQAGVRLGLDTIRELTTRLGEPHRACLTIHVAGTNGKGSVVAFVEHALRAAGHRTGAFVSPKLTTDADQVRVNGAPVDAAAFAEAVLRVRRAAANPPPVSPTYFEVITAAAFELFRRDHVDVAVVEAGMGGALDATNIVTPIAGAITNVSFDHVALLGATLESIATHKAGIVKPGTRVVIGAMDPEAEAVIRRVAAGVCGRVERADESCGVSARMEQGRAVLEVTTPEGRYGPVRLALRGEHQVLNALVAIRLLERVRAAGVPIPHAAIEAALSGASWPARLELLEFPEGRTLLIDAAHNAAGASVLARHLARWHPERPPLVFAALRDKDVRAMFRSLLPVVGPIVVTAAPSPRTSAPGELADVVRALDQSRTAIVEPDPVRAVERAWSHGAFACVAGSIFLAGAVRGALHPRAIVGSSL